MFISKILNVDLNYNIDQSIGVYSWNSSTISENNIDNKDNSCKKLMQESSKFSKL